MEEIVKEIETNAQKLRVSIRQVCIKAGIDPTTFSRWKNGSIKSAGVSQVEAMRSVLKSLAADRGVKL